MYDTNTLVEYEGTFCVLSESTDYDDPMRTRVWYPTSDRVVSYTREYIGAHVVTAMGSDSVYRIERYADGSFCRVPGNGLCFRLVNGGKTMPVHGEREPVPCPRVRKGIETRWYRGGWEKYIKSQGGWIPLEWEPAKGERVRVRHASACSERGRLATIIIARKDDGVSKLRISVKLDAAIDPDAPLWLSFEARELEPVTAETKS